MNFAKLYQEKRSLVVANVGPMVQPATKDVLMADPSLVPESLMSHVVGTLQWGSAQTVSAPTSGWGGRIADNIYNLSGKLPPVLNTGGNSIFQVGRQVQGIALQAGSAALPPAINSTVYNIASSDATSTNRLVAQTALLRARAMEDQVLLSKAMSTAPVATTFTGSSFGSTMNTLIQVLNGRAITEASRQLFYVNQGDYDTHASQQRTQSDMLSDLDVNLGAFFNALDTLGLTDQVLVCTHSDFGRSMQANTTVGSDHGWGNHQLVMGGGIAGGKILGALPELELGGKSDFTGQGIWIPTTSVTQMTAGIGQWLGLQSAQIADVFPDLGRFPAGALKFV